jgi:hypothetical protein
MENLKVKNAQLVQTLAELNKTTSRLRALHRAWREMNSEGVSKWRGRAASTMSAHAR